MAALFTPAVAYEFWHFLIAIYITAGCVIASVYAVAWLRGRRDQRLAFALPFTVAAVLTPVQLVVGDLSGRALVQDQPPPSHRGRGRFDGFGQVRRYGDHAICMRLGSSASPACQRAATIES